MAVFYLKRLLNIDFNEKHYSIYNTYEKKLLKNGLNYNYSFLSYNI